MMEATCLWRQSHPDPVWERLREAMLDLVAERGFQEVDEWEVAERAGIFPPEFHGYFRDADDCFRQILAGNCDAIYAAVLAAYQAEAGWRDGLRAAAYAAARLIRAFPREFRFAMTPDAGDLALASRDAFLQRLVDLVDEGRRELDDPCSVSRDLAEGILGSIVEHATFALHDPDGQPDIEGFVPEFMYLAVSAYMGNEAGLEELTMPAPTGLPEPARA